MQLELDKARFKRLIKNIKVKNQKLVPELNKFWSLDLDKITHLATGISYDVTQDQRKVLTKILNQ